MAVSTGDFCVGARNKTAGARELTPTTNSSNAMLCIYIQNIDRERERERERERATRWGNYANEQGGLKQNHKSQNKSTKTTYANEERDVMM